MRVQIFGCFQVIISNGLCSRICCKIFTRTFTPVKLTYTSGHIAWFGLELWHLNQPERLLLIYQSICCCTNIYVGNVWWWSLSASLSQPRCVLHVRMNLVCASVKNVMCTKDCATFEIVHVNWLLWENIWWSNRVDFDFSCMHFLFFFLVCRGWRPHSTPSDWMRQEKKKNRLPEPLRGERWIKETTTL